MSDPTACVPHPMGPRCPLTPTDPHGSIVAEFGDRATKAVVPTVGLSCLRRMVQSENMRLVASLERRINIDMLVRLPLSRLNLRVIVLLIAGVKTEPLSKRANQQSHLK